MTLKVISKVNKRKNIMTDLSLHIDSTSFILISASFADQSISSSYSTSASWAPAPLLPASESWASSSISASYASTASLLLGSITNAVSASYASNGSIINWYSASLPNDYTFTMQFAQSAGDIKMYFQCISNDSATGWVEGDIIPLEGVNDANIAANGGSPHRFINFGFNTGSLYTGTTWLQFDNNSGYVFPNKSSGWNGPTNINNFQFLFRVTSP